MKKKQNTAPVMKPEQRIQLCQLLAEGKTTIQVIAYFRREHKLKITENGVRHYRNSPKWQAKIRELRVRWETEIADEFLASKRIRMRCLEDAYRKASDWHPVKRDKDGKITLKKCNPGAAVKALQAAREEMVGSKLVLGAEDDVMDLMRTICGEIADEGRKLPSLREDAEEEFIESEMAPE